MESKCAAHKKSKGCDLVEVFEDSELINENFAEDLSENADIRFPVYLSRQHGRRFSSYKSYRRQNRNLKARIIRRLIKKSGKSNIKQGKIPTRWYYYLLDLGNTLISSRWRWTILSLTSSFMLSWLLFATAWMLISNANGDFDLVNPSETPCLTGIQGFSGFLMFSLETQQTIGYGSRYINHYCPEGTFMMCLQIIMGCAICGGMVSIVYAKMVSPLQINSKSLFSKKAVICLRDSTLCLIFRARDDNSRYAVGTKINAYLVQSRIEEPYLKSIVLESYGMLIWPLEVVHRITTTSPFWDLSAKELITRRFEIIVTMQGTSVVTGQSSETRTSYLSTEILWGYKFKPCISFEAVKGCYFVNHRDFNTTEEVLTPLCSAKRFDEVIDDIVSPSIQSPCNGIVFNFDDRQTIFNNQFDTPEYNDNGSLYDELDYADTTVLPIEIYDYVNDIKEADKGIAKKAVKKIKTYFGDSNDDFEVETMIASLESVLQNSDTNSTPSLRQINKL